MKNLQELFESSIGGMEKYLQVSSNISKEMFSAVEQYNNFARRMEQYQEAANKFKEDFVNDPIKSIIELPTTITNNYNTLISAEQEKELIIEEIILMNKKHSGEILMKDNKLVYRLYLSGCNISNTNIEIIDNIIHINKNGILISKIYPRISYDISNPDNISLQDGILEITLNKINNKIKLNFNI